MSLTSISSSFFVYSALVHELGGESEEAEKEKVGGASAQDGHFPSGAHTRFSLRLPTNETLLIFWKMKFFKLPLLLCSLIFLLFIVFPTTNAQEEESFFRLQKSGRPMMKAFMNRFPYHNPMFTLREEGGSRRPFSGF